LRTIAAEARIGFRCIISWSTIICGVFLLVIIMVDEPRPVMTSYRSCRLVGQEMPKLVTECCFRYCSEQWLISYSLKYSAHHKIRRLSESRHYAWMPIMSEGCAAKRTVPSYCNEPQIVITDCKEINNAKTSFSTS
jgi:hypothetical protein